MADKASQAGRRHKEGNSCLLPRASNAAIDRLKRLFGVAILADVHERACDLGIALPPGKRRRHRAELISRSGLLFVHIPKNAGMSINKALYGEKMSHSSIRYYRSAASKIAAELPSFAIIRDPIERFISAYNYARRGGEPGNRIGLPFFERYRSFNSIEDAILHVESARSPYDLDYIFRRQSWYVTDRSKRIAVDTLVPFSKVAQVADFVPQMSTNLVQHLNAAKTEKPVLTPGQVDRIRRLYADDFDLFAATS